MIDEEYICEKITRLRIERNITARDMSLSLGQNPGYINCIENKKSLPSMQMFLYICDYLKISPRDFFDGDSDWDPVIADICDGCKKLSGENREIILSLINALGKGNE